MLLPYTIAVILSEYWNHSKIGRTMHPLRLTVYGQVGGDEWVEHYAYFRDGVFGQNTENKWHMTSTKEVFQAVSFAQRWDDLVVTYDYPRAELAEAFNNYIEKRNVRSRSIQVGGNCPFCNAYPLADAPCLRSVKVQQKGRPECTECYSAGLRYDDVLAKEGYFDGVFALDPIIEGIFKGKGYILE